MRARLLPSQDCSHAPSPSLRPALSQDVEFYPASSLKADWGHPSWWGPRGLWVPGLSTPVPHSDLRSQELPSDQCLFCGRRPELVVCGGGALTDSLDPTSQTRSHLFPKTEPTDTQSRCRDAWAPLPCGSCFQGKAKLPPAEVAQLHSSPVSAIRTQLSQEAKRGGAS